MKKTIFITLIFMAHPVLHAQANKSTTTVTHKSEIVTSEDQDEKKQLAKLRVWLKGADYVITKKRFVCTTQESFRKAFNFAYQGQSQAALNYMEGNGCQIIAADTRAKLLKISDDKRLVLIEYQVPYSYIVFKAWTNRGFIVTREAYKSGML